MSKQKGSAAKGGCLIIVFFVLAFFVYFLRFENEADSMIMLGDYALFNVVSGSMEPEIPLHSLLLTKRVDISQVQVGDDVTYRSGDYDIITHRVIEIWENYEDTGERALRTQGLRNEFSDEKLVMQDNFIGVVVMQSAALGKLVYLLRQYGAWLGLMGVLIYGFCVSVSVALGLDERKSKRHTPDPPQD